MDISIMLCGLFLCGLDVNSDRSWSPTQPRSPTFAYVSEHNVELSCAAGPGSQACRYFVPDRLKNGSSAPVVVMLHGGMFGDVSLYRGHIEHLCRQGILVIFASYLREDLRGGFEDLVLDGDHGMYLERAIAGTEIALERIGPMADRDQVFLFAHSSGSTLALSWPNQAWRPRGMVLANPVFDPRAHMPALFSWMLRIKPLDWKTAAHAVLCPVFILCGEEDEIGPCEDSLEIQDALYMAPVKPVFRLSSDRWGTPPLKAGHLASLSSVDRHPEALLRLFGQTVAVDTADFRFYWSALDALLAGESRVSFDMGSWSDGTPLLPVVDLTPG